MFHSNIPSESAIIDCLQAWFDDKKRKPKTSNTGDEATLLPTTTPTIRPVQVPYLQNHPITTEDLYKLEGRIKSILLIKSCATQEYNEKLEELRKFKEAGDTNTLGNGKMVISVLQGNLEALINMLEGFDKDLVQMKSELVSIQGGQ